MASDSERAPQMHMRNKSSYDNTIWVQHSPMGAWETQNGLMLLGGLMSWADVGLRALVSTTSMYHLSHTKD